ncbi:Oncosphere antigen A [Taenia solium]
MQSIRVKLKAISPYSVRMRWDPPTEPYGSILGYIVNWRLDSGLQGEIHLRPIPTHVFADLRPRQTISASVKALTEKGLFLKHRYVSGSSRVVKATTPRLEGGASSQSPPTMSTPDRKTGVPIETV